MSITSINERYEERSISQNKDGYTGTRTFIVESGIPNESEIDILSHDDIPDIGDAYPAEVYLRLRNKECALLNEDSRKVFIVTCEYGNDTGGYSTSGVDEAEYEDKTDLPASITFHPQIIEVPFEAGYDFTYTTPNNTGTLAFGDDTEHNQSVPVQNSSGNPFPESAKMDYDLQVTIHTYRSVSNVDLNNLYSYQLTCNSNPLTLAGLRVGAYHALMKSIVPRVDYEKDGEPIWDLTFEILLRKRSWRDRPLDTGLYRLTDPDPDSSGSVETQFGYQILDDDGQRITEPAKLNGSGEPLSNGADSSSAPEPYLLEYFPYWATRWESLSLPEEDKRVT